MWALLNYPFGGSDFQLPGESAAPRGVDVTTRAAAALRMPEPRLRWERKNGRGPRISVLWGLWRY